MSSVSERLGNWLPVLIALSLPLVWMPNLVDSFVLPRASIAITAACLGAGLALLIQNKPGLGSLRWPLIAAVAAAFLAFALSVSWPLSFVGGYTRYESLPIRLSYLGLLAVPVWLLRTELARTALVASVVFGAAVCSLEAIGQWLLSVPFRPDGNLGNANLLGALIAIALPLSIAQMLRRDLFTVAWGLCAAAMVAGLVVSTSRSGALGALAGCAALAVFALRGRVAALAAIASAVIVFAALLVILISPLRGLNNDPGPTRLHLYPDALRMVAARPFTGWGEDSTGLVFGQFLTGDWAPGVTFDRAHSGPLDLGATQGVIGLASLGWVLIILFRGMWRWRFAPSPRPGGPPRVAPVRVGAIGAACVGYTVWVLFNFDWAPATGVFWLLAGTAWSVVRVEEPRQVISMDRPPIGWSPAGYAGRVCAAVGLVAVAVALGAMPILADAWYAQGRPDLAVRVDPLQAQYHRALGEALIAGGSRADGLGELRVSARLGATDPALYVELGDAERREGNETEARADYQRALTIDPYWAPARQRLSATGGLGAA